MTFPKDPSYRFYNQISSEGEVQKQISGLRRQPFRCVVLEEPPSTLFESETSSRRVFEVPLKYAGYRHGPSAYLVCTKDQAIGVEPQEVMSSDGFDFVERVEADHSPFLSRPQETADFIKRFLATL